MSPLIPTREMELDMMASPGRWPRSFRLPLVRPGEAGFLTQLSMADPTPPPEPVVYLGTIWSSVPLEQRGSIRYGSLEEIYADGWRVD